MTFLNELDNLLETRFKDRPEGSYTTSLFDAGVDRIARKIGEEAAELIVAAKNQDNEECRNEAADLLFHLMVLCRSQGISLADVEAVLKDRSV